MRIFSLALATVLLASVTQARPTDLWSQTDQVPLNELKSGTEKDARVNVTLYVMSRCPDARLCESVFDDVLQSSRIRDKINFRLDFVAHANKSEPLGVTCKHGELECLGNIHDLCLQRHTSLSESWATIQCQNFESPFPGRIGEIELTKRCAKASRVDWWESGVGECVEGAKAKPGRNLTAQVGHEGKELLLASVRRTEQAGVEKSCTIDIGTPGKRRCIVDDGKWSGCDDGHTASDFIRIVEEEWKSLQRNKA